MNAMRGIERIIAAHIAPVGTFTVKRVLPDAARRSVGPWVFLDHFGPFRIKPGEDGVGPHPHAGIETVTYLLSGRNRHRDSAGHEGIVGPLGAQWMTAGRGIIHAEAPLAESEAEMTMHGIQLWTSLPRALKLTEPGYQRIEAAAIPELAVGGGTLRIVAGAFGERAQGPASTLMPLFLWHARLPVGTAMALPVVDGFEAAAYVFAGRLSVCEADVPEAALAVLSGDAGDIILANDSGAPAEAMLLGGAPAEGPLVFHGPFVMNSIEQVRFAERAYHTGQMGSLAP